MWTRNAALLASVLFCGSLQAQDLSQPFRPLDEYLGLTQVQIAAIEANNNRFFRLTSDRLARRGLLISLATVELTRSPIDAVVVGQNYAEAETICRDLRAARVRLREDNLAILTEAQKMKMRVLEEAVKVIGIASMAERRNLADFGGVTPPSQLGISLGISDPLSIEGACNSSLNGFLTGRFLGIRP